MDFRETDSHITVLFLLLAIAAIVVYFVFDEGRTWFYLLSGIAITIRIGQYVARFIHNRRARKQRREKLKNEFPIE